MARILVVGAGIAGLSTVFELVNTAFISTGQAPIHQITILDKRTEFTRERDIFLDSELVKKYFDTAGLKECGYKLLWSVSKLGSDEEPLDINTEYLYLEEASVAQDAILPPLSRHILAFLKTTSDNLGFTSIKMLQEYLLQAIHIRLEDLEMRGGVHSQAEIKLGYKIVDIRVGKKNTAILQNTIASDEEVILQEFDNIIVADGVHSETLRILASKRISLPEIKHLSSSDNEAYASAVFHYGCRGDSADICAPRILSSILDTKLALAVNDYANHDPQSQWAKEKSDALCCPSMRVTMHHVSHKMDITGQVPESFLSLEPAEQRQAIGIWFTTIVQKYFGDALSSIEMISGSSFVHPKEYYSSPFFKLGEGNGYIIGDSRMPSLFLLGHGVEKAIQDSMIIASLLNSSNSDESILSEMTRSTIENYEYMLAQYIAFKYTKLAQALTNCVTSPEVAIAAAAESWPNSHDDRDFVAMNLSQFFDTEF